MIKYGIRHKTNGKYLDCKLGGTFYYQDFPKTDINEYWDFMSMAILNIIALNGEDFLEVFLKEFNMSKSIQLTEKHTGGLHNGIKYYADHKRISREEFQDIKQRADKLECMSNGSVNGVMTFYTTARFN